MRWRYIRCRIYVSKYQFRNEGSFLIQIQFKLWNLVKYKCSYCIFTEAVLNAYVKYVALNVDKTKTKTFELSVSQESFVEIDYKLV